MTYPRRLSAPWTIGWDAEWNSWVTLYGPTHLRAGAANTCGTSILRFPLASEQFNLRTTASLGFSCPLIGLHGAPRGAVGLHAALHPRGIEYKVSRTFLLIVKPLEIAVPVLQLDGLPLSCPQYRFHIGFGVMNG